MEPMLELDGRTSAARDRLIDLIVERFRGMPGGTHELRVDRENGRVTYQGGWWYRGEYDVEPDESGSVVRYRVFNAATRARWAVPLANRFFVGFQDSQRAEFQRLLREAASET